MLRVTGMGKRGLVVGVHGRQPGADGVEALAGSAGGAHVRMLNELVAFAYVDAAVGFIWVIAEIQRDGEDFAGGNNDDLVVGVVSVDCHWFFLVKFSGVSTRDCSPLGRTSM